MFNYGVVIAEYVRIQIAKIIFAFGFVSIICSLLWFSFNVYFYPNKFQPICYNVTIQVDSTQTKDHVFKIQHVVKANADSSPSYIYDKISNDSHYNAVAYGLFQHPIESVSINANGFSCEQDKVDLDLTKSN